MSLEIESFDKPHTSIPSASRAHIYCHARLRNTELVWAHVNIYSLAVKRNDLLDYH